MVFVSIHGNLHFLPWEPEVVGVEPTIGGPLTTLPSKKIHSPSLIHIVSEPFIPEDQISHAL